MRTLALRAQAREAAAKDSSQAVVIDVTNYGMSKVLGKGQLPSQPVVVSDPAHAPPHAAKFSLAAGERAPAPPCIT